MNGTTERDTSERQSRLAASGLHPKHSAPLSLYYGGAHLSKLPICSADSYIQANHQGLRGKSFQETAHYIRRWLSDISQVQLAATQIFAPWVPPRGLVRASLNPKTCKPKTGLDILTARQRFYLLFLLFYYFFLLLFSEWAESMMCVVNISKSHTSILALISWSLRCWMSTDNMSQQLPTCFPSLESLQPFALGTKKSSSFCSPLWMCCNISSSVSSEVFHGFGLTLEYDCRSGQL